MTVTDAAPWSVEVGFRHLEGAAPRPEFETVAYVTWDADEGGMRILGLCYDAAKKTLVLLNGGGREPPIPADLSGAFHAVRMTASDGQVRVYVDGALKGGPVPLAVLRYSQAPGIYIGPITSGEPGPLRYEFDYLAWTDADLAPGAGGWDPASAAEPVAEGLTPVASVFTQAPYRNIRVIARQQGNAAWQAAIPELLAQAPSDHRPGTAADQHSLVPVPGRAGAEPAECLPQLHGTALRSRNAVWRSRS